jgi:hypothetical protein
MPDENWDLYTYKFPFGSPLKLAINLTLLHRQKEEAVTLESLQAET